MPGPAGTHHHYDHRIGRLLRAHGLEGDLVLQLFRARRVDPSWTRWRRVRDPEPVELELFDTRTENHGLVAAKFVDGATAIVRFDGVDDRNAAERLVSAFVDIDPRRAPDLVADEADRLFGAQVHVDGEPFGRVDDLRDNGAQPLLLVGEEQVMIPLVDAFVQGVEQTPDGSIVHVRSIPGLLEANRPSTPDPE